MNLIWMTWVICRETRVSQIKVKSHAKTVSRTVQRQVLIVVAIVSRVCPKGHARLIAIVQGGCLVLATASVAMQLTLAAM